MVVGIDIGSDKHYARAFMERGMEISRKAIVFENTESGFGQLDTWMEKLAEENGKTKIMVGFTEILLYAFAFDMEKLHAKTQQNRLKTMLFIPDTA